MARRSFAVIESGIKIREFVDPNSSVLSTTIIANELYEHVSVTMVYNLCAKCAKLILFHL